MAAPTATPLVSVCIPTFNAARFIDITIESVLGQTLKEFELVIRDDASTDDTVEKVSRVNDARIRLIRNERNTGIAANWNGSVRECRAPCVKLLCQDDLIYPTCLQKEFEILANPRFADVGLVCGYRDVIDEFGRVRMRGRGRLPGGTVPGVEAIRRIVQSGTNPVGEPAAVMFRKSIFEAAGGFDGSLPYMIDVDFWCRALRLSQLHTIQEALSAFRVSREALSSTIARSQSMQARAYFRRLAEDRSWGVKKADAIVGQIKASLFAPVRRMLYRMWF
jgi:glycosyltransferase involved in cell wall biosynthesis